VVASYTDQGGTNEVIESVPSPAVSDVNDAPVLDASASPALTTIDENTPSPTSGSTAGSTLVSALVSLGGNVSDIDTNALTGIAITAVNLGGGTLRYSTDGGTSWSDVGAVSNTSALLLKADANTLLHFTPPANYIGSLADVMTFKAWDQTSGSAGSKVDTTTGSAFSSASDTVSVNVRDKNAPAIDLDAGNPDSLNHSFNAPLADTIYSIDNASSAQTVARLTDQSNIRSLAVSVNTAVAVTAGEALSLGGTSIALSGTVPSSVTVGGVSWSLSLSGGVLTFTAPADGATASNAQTLLRNLGYSYTSAPTGSRTLSWTATDMANNVSSPVVTTISFDDAAPVIDLNGNLDGLDFNSTLVTSANAGTGVALTSGATVTESNNITRLDLRVGGLLNGSSEKFVVGSTELNADGSSLPSSVSDGTNSWTLSYDSGVFSFSLANANAAQAQALMNSLTYKNSAASLSDGVRTFTVSATDEFGQASDTAAVATVVVNSALPTRASTNSVITEDANGDGIKGDSFVIKFSESVLISNITDLQNWTVSNPVPIIRNGDFANSAGWVTTSAHPSTGTLTISNGRASFNGGGNTSGSVLQQVIQTVPGTSYTVSFTLASSSTGTVRLQAFAFDGSNQLAVSTASTTGTTARTFSLSFVAQSASTELRFSDNLANTGNDTWLDNVQVVTPAQASAGSLGSGARIEALDVITVGGVDYASQYRITAGAGAAYGTGSVLRIPNTLVVDTGNVNAGASGDLTFTMTDISPPAGLTPGDAAVTSDNIISSAAGDASVTLTYNFTVSDASHSKVRYYLDGVELAGKVSNISSPSARSATLTMARADWGSDGIKSLTARLEDSEGNLGPQSQSRPVTVDTQIMQGATSMVRTSGSNANASAGDVITVSFHEAVQLSSPLPSVFGSTATASAIGAVNGYSKNWNITLGGTGISLSDSTGSVTFSGVKDVAQNTGTLMVSVPTDVLAMPRITSLGNITADNVINGSEITNEQTMNLELASVSAGDVIKVYKDGVPISFIVTVSGVDQEVSSYTLPVGVASTTTLPIKLKPEFWGGDGERVLTATIQRGAGTVFVSDERHVYVAADQGHWSTAHGNAIWFDPSTEISLSDGKWSASVGGLETAVVNAGRTPTLVRSRDGANYVSFSATENQSNTAAVLQALVPTATLDMAGKTSFSIFNVQQRVTISPTQLFTLGVGSTQATGYINGYSATFNWSQGAIRAYAANSSIAQQPALVDLVTVVSGGGSNLTGTDYSYVNGKLSATATNNISTYNYSQSLSFGGNAAVTYSTHAFDGSWTGDLILFNQALTSLAARQEINTYLAIKYKTMGKLVTALSGGIYDLATSASDNNLIDDVLDRRTAGAINDEVLVAGSDWVNTGAGDDTIRIKDLKFRLIDGGVGHDKLALASDYSGPQSIVLSDFVSNARGNSATNTSGNARVALAGFHKLLGIEQIDLSTHIGAQSLTVTAADVNELSESNTLHVDLGTNDSLTAIDFAINSATWGYYSFNNVVYDQRWTQTNGPDTYTLYARGGALPNFTPVAGATNGADTLTGTTGNDLLQGGQGNDTLTGGDAADIFRFIAGELGSDLITDFDKGEGDKLDLRLLLAGKGMDSAVSDSVKNFISLSRSSTTDDAVLKIDVDGLGEFDQAELDVTLQDAWVNGNLLPATAQSDLQNLMSLINDRVILV
jgi:hypothetical protein